MLGYSDGDGVGDIDVDGDVDGERARLMISLRFVPAAVPPPVSATCNGLSEQAEVSNGSIHSSKV